MVDRNIIAYIKKARQNDGLSDDDIRRSLLSVGWSENDIDEGFKIIDGLKEIPPEKPFPIREEVLRREPSLEEKNNQEFLKDEGFSEKPPKRFGFKKQYLIPLLIIVVLIFIGGVFAIFYDKFAKLDPASILPQDTAFYLNIKISPEDNQVKNFKEILNKFPYYGKFSDKINEEFENLKDEQPWLENLDFSISDEIIIAWITPLDLLSESSNGPEELSIVLILPDPDLKKLEKLAKDIQKEMEGRKDWRIETEKYSGRDIIKAIPTGKTTDLLPSGSIKFEPSTTFSNGHFILASKPEDIKKIIDVADAQKVTNFFKKDKIKNINSGLAFKKIKKYLPKDYLIIFYGESDLSKLLKTPGVTGTVSKAENLFGRLSASLKTAINLPFFKGKEIEDPEKVAFAGAIIAEKDEIKMESYSLDMREDTFLPTQFSFKDSLVNFIPEKIGNREIVYYSEGSNLESNFDYFEEIFTKEMAPEEKENFEDFQKMLELIIGVDLKRDIIALFKNNYAFLVASGSTGKENPVVSFIFEVDDEKKAKDKLLKLKVPNIEEYEEQSRLRARDDRIMFDLDVLRVASEMFYSEEGSYKNINCQYDGDLWNVKAMCDNIKNQSGSRPIIWSSTKKYSAYSKRIGGGYYCVDSVQKVKGTETSIYPGGKGYCTSKTFLCPKTSGTITRPVTPEFPLKDMVSFSKETVDGFEIYTIPVYEEYGLNFSIKDKRLIFTFTKDGLVNILKGIASSGDKKLKDDPRFAEQFKEIPKEITGAFYLYPYGSLGLVKYLLNFYFDLAVEESSVLSGNSKEISDQSDLIKEKISEFLDRGIAPYLKILKSAGSYSYSPEEGLAITKGKVIIGELTTGEIETTEQFWETFPEWVGENFGPLLGPMLLSPEPYPAF